MEDQYCVYLRKSRKDIDAEKRGEGATLDRHRLVLEQLATKQRLNVTHTFEEVASGETLEARPQMQEMLRQIEKRIWKGVLVVEVERLTRGALSDQDLITKTFLYTDTLIVTPFKTYDLSNPSDYEYFGFSLFWSNKEYLTINRRQQSGRKLSIIEGKYPGNRAPFGYRRKKLENMTGWTLEENPDEAKIVRLIFDLYVNGNLQPDGNYKRLGTALIVRRLDQLGYKPQKRDNWAVSSIRDILINPVYIGKLRWNWRATKKDMVNGQEEKSRPRAKDDKYLLVDGLHKAIIDTETFNKAQEYMKKNPPRPIGERKTVKNPLAGIVVCGICKRRMVRRPYGKTGNPDTLMCAAASCPNVSSHLHLVEQKLIELLEDKLADYKLKWNTDSKPQKVKNTMLDETREAIIKQNKKIKELNDQINEVDDLYERKKYSEEKHTKRTLILEKSLQQAEDKLKELEEDLKTEEEREVNLTLIIPTFEKIIDTYRALQTPQAKNDLLKEVLKKVEYFKEEGGRWSEDKNNFKLKIYSKLPL